MYFKHLYFKLLFGGHVSFKHQVSLVKSDDS